MGATRRLVCLLGLVAPLLAHAGERYQNHSGYGLALDVPAHARACTTQPPGPDHGVALFFDGGPCDAEAGRQRPSIEFFVYFNAADGPDGEPVTSARRLADVECAGHRVVPSRERLGSLPLYECVKDGGAGFVKLVLVAQKAGKDDVSAWNDYTVTVSCPRGDLPLWRRRLHAILRRASVVPSPA